MLDRFVQRLTIDNEARSFEIETADGAVHRYPTAFAAEPEGLGLPPDFRLVSYEPADRSLTLTPADGEPLVIELFDGGSQTDRRANRPAVYLDQNKWVLLAQAIHTPERVPRRELPAALELIRVAEEQRVILLLSSGHLIETARVDRHRRRDLGPLMVRLSRGWLMSDPLLVRRAELVRMFRQRTGASLEPAAEVITLDLSRLYLEPTSSGPQGDPDLPEELRLLSEMMSMAAAVFALLIEDQVTHSEEGYTMARLWAESYRSLGVELGSNTRAREMSRDVTRAMFLSDLSHDLAEVVTASGMSARDFEIWLVDVSEDDIASLPYMGRMRDVLHLRLRNPSERWGANDLVDMMYLPCAAAYADFVVAENQARHHLLRAQHGRTDGAQVMSSVAELVERLEL